MNKGAEIIEAMDKALYKEIIINSKNLLKNKDIVTSYSKIEKEKKYF